MCVCYSLVSILAFRPKLPKSNLTNGNILCLVRFGSVPTRTN